MVRTSRANKAIKNYTSTTLTATIHRLPFNCVHPTPQICIAIGTGWSRRVYIMRALGERVRSHSRQFRKIREKLHQQNGNGSCNTTRFLVISIGLRPWNSCNLEWSFRLSTTWAFQILTWAVKILEWPTCHQITTSTRVENYAKNSVCFCKNKHFHQFKTNHYTGFICSGTIACAASGAFTTVYGETMWEQMWWVVQKKHVFSILAAFDWLMFWCKTMSEMFWLSVCVSLSCS